MTAPEESGRRDAPDELPSAPRAEEADAVDAVPEEAPDEPAPLPTPVEAVLERIPAEDRDKVRASFQSLFQYTGPMPNPLFGKLKDAHLDKIIEGAENDNRRSYEDRDHHRKHVQLITICSLATFVVAAGIFLWAKQVQALHDLIQLAVIFAGGIGVGLGFRRK